MGERSGAVLRLKRSADAAALDEIAISLPPAKRSRLGLADGDLSTVTPQRTIRFRRVDSSAQNRRVIDVDLAGLLDSPAPAGQPASPGNTSTPVKPANKDAGKMKENGDSTAANSSSGNSRTPTGDFQAETNSNSTKKDSAASPAKVVFDLYEAVPATEDSKKSSSGVVGLIDTSSLPSEFFGELMPSDESDEDYSEGDERSVDYPSTPSSSNGSEGSENEKDDISDGEIGALYTEQSHEREGDLWNMLEPPARSTRSKYRNQNPVGGTP